MVRRPAPKTTRTYRIGEAEWHLIEAAAAVVETHPSSYVREAALREARRDVSAGVRSDPLSVRAVERFA